ncbi:fungal-specific transcription factor domain-containing protein [Stachybotrys elegans]|uniref:Fungal-specific transcription factor domain-containing protein n=1 Tax=Stachybotrys elegans TaxID=80388 RepID=A0A8K0WV91_9HYPO|nr:fungal-specific transcription factor domain-containing protein [Stachybotrys elegans]
MMMRSFMGGKVRSNNGCYTCRLRRKKCDESRPICSSCQTLEITCHFGDSKPDWMDSGPKQREMADRIKAQVKKQATQRRDRKYLEILESGTRKFHLSDDAAAAASATPTPTPPSSTDTGPTPSSSNTSAGSPPEVSWHVQAFPRKPEPQAGPDHDIHFIMIYLDYVFPHLFPFYKPSVLTGGRGWIMDTVQRNKAVYHSVISLASYYFSLVVAGDTIQHKACTDRMVTQLQTQLELGLRELQREVEAIQGQRMNIQSGLVAMESILQMLIFEVATSHSQNWIMHLDGAIAIFMQIIPDPDSWTEALTNSLGEVWPKAADMEVSLRPWSTSQAAMRFFTGNLLFMDVMASVTLGSVPRLCSYQGTITPGCDHQVAERPPQSPGPIALQEFVGLANMVVQMIGDVATLHSWKKAQRKAGSLSVHELVARGKVLEDAIKGCLEFMENALDANKANMHEDRTFAGAPVQDPMGTTRPIYGAVLPPALLMHNFVWLQATLTYLHTVISGWQPSAPEIQASVAKTRDYLLNLPSSSSLKTMVWPFCVSGCLSPPEDEDIYRCIMRRLGPLQVFGTMQGAMQVMEKMWSIRDQIDEQWDMAQCLNVLGYGVLLI